MDQEDKFQWQASFGILIVFFIDSTWVFVNTVFW